MELIDIETSFEPYAEEVQEHLKYRHWNITYYCEEKDDYFEAIGYKNEQGTWDIFFNDCPKDYKKLFDSFCKKNPDDPNDLFLFTVKLRADAEEKFFQLVEDVIAKRKTG